MGETSTGDLEVRFDDRRIAVRFSHLSAMQHRSHDPFLRKRPGKKITNTWTLLSGSRSTSSDWLT